MAGGILLETYVTISEYWFTTEYYGEAALWVLTYVRVCAQCRDVGNTIENIQTTRGKPDR